MSKLDTTAKRATPHLILWLLTAMVGAFFIWATFGRLDVVAVALGEVVPSSQVRSVEHFEGGIVRSILVREGDRVGAGQSLVELDPIRSDADMRALAVRQTDLRIDIARLQSEATGQDTIDFDEDLIRTYPERTARAQELFESRRNRFSNDVTAQRQRIEQRKSEISSIQQRIQNNSRRLGLVKEQIEISDGLVADQLSNRMTHLNLLKEAAALESRISEDRGNLPGAQAALNEHEADLLSLKARQQSESREQLQQRQSELREIEANLLKLQDQLSRTTLRSPVDGVIKTLHVTTQGAVIPPGGTVLDVVPVTDRLIIEARLPTQDIGYVQIGQGVNVSLASADAIRFGRIEGEVVGISPDSIESEDGIPYYRVRIETLQTRFERHDVTYDLFPGVQVTCAIRTGERTVLAYLLDPFFTSVQTAMRER